MTQQSSDQQAGLWKKTQAAICNYCPLCRQARKNPDSLVGRLLHHPLHSQNCPVWKAYQEVYGPPDN